MKNVTKYLPGLRMLWGGRRKRTEDECKIGQKKESEHVHQDTDVRAKRQAPSGDLVTGCLISFRWLGYRVVHPTPHLEQFCFSLDRHEILAGSVQRLPQRMCEGWEADYSDRQDGTRCINWLQICAQLHQCLSGTKTKTWYTAMKMK